MKRSLMQLFAGSSQRPLYILVDSMPLKIDFLDTDIVAFPYGESKSISIAAASIIAKVTRDRIIERLGQVFPGYDLDKHKGYCTAQHREKLQELESSIIHRTTFIDHYDSGANPLHERDYDQATIW